MAKKKKSTWDDHMRRLVGFDPTGGSYQFCQYCGGAWLPSAMAGHQAKCAHNPHARRSGLSSFLSRKERQANQWNKFQLPPTEE